MMNHMKMLKFLTLFVFLPIFGAGCGSSALERVPAKVTEPEEMLCRDGAYESPSEQEIFYDEGIKKDAFVIHVRKALDAYLAKSFVPCADSTCVAGKVKGTHHPDSAVDDLDQLPADKSDYLKGKFIVLSTDIAPGGGESIVLMFKGKPDVLFYAWVYGYGGDGYDLRSFSVFEQTEENGLKGKDIKKIYINQLCAQDFGL